ncbi:MAG: chloride channel protein, partial [Polyangiales bacterium]
MSVRRGESIRRLAKRASLAAAIGVIAGALSAVFLHGLDFVTRVRLDFPWLLFALPFAGLILGAAIERWGGRALGGTSLVLDAVYDTRTPRQPDDRVPGAMAPWVLFGTWWTHLFGGSAGREGTAVQMGASVAEVVSARTKLDAHDRRVMLHAGIAAGFGSVFGTPCAGAIFAIEVSRIGRLEGEAMLPAFIAAVVGDLVTRGLAVRHTQYLPVSPATLDLPMIARLLTLGVAAGLASRTFVVLTERVKSIGAKRLPSLPLRMFVGGLIVVALSRIPGAAPTLGLGVPTIVSASFDASMKPWLFAMKIVMTALTVGSGFIGGEVTPLFFVGATLGNALARPLGLPLPFAAGVMLPAVFAAASN